MKKEEEYIDWEKEGPHLQNISKENPFRVPNGYFEDLNLQLLSQVKLEDFKKTQVFEVPENYFGNLENQIMSQIKINSIVNQKDGFNVADTYFEESKERIENKIKTVKKTAKIFNLNFVRYAAAACILLMTSVGIYINIERQQNVSYQLSKLPDEAIENYLLMHTDVNDLPTIIENIDENSVFSLDQEKLSDDQIKNYLEYTQ